MYKSFDESYETKGVCHWHKGLLHKPRENGIPGNLHVVTNFLHQRKQKVVLDEQYSSWIAIEAGVPQGSILG